MKNKKFIVSTFFLILSGILINNIWVFIYQNNSIMHLQNFSQYSESSTAPFGILTKSESEDGNLVEFINLYISNSKGIIEFVPGVGYTSYIGGNITVEFKLIDGNISQNIIFDENNLASYLIRYDNTSGVTDNGTLLNRINFNNNTKRYKGVIGTSVLTEGTYTIAIYINLLNYTIIPYVFALTIKALTYMQNISFYDPGGKIKGPGFNFFIGSNISIEFKLREIGVNISYILDEDNQTTYLIIYNKTSGTIENEILSNHINFNNKTEKYSGILETSGLSEGNYAMTINIDLLNNTFVPHSFNFLVRKKYNVLISINKPREFIAGEKLTVSIFTQYKELLDPFEGVSIKLTVRINDGIAIAAFTQKTNSFGYISFVFILPLKTIKISLEVEVPSAFNHESAKLEISDIRVITFLEVVIMLVFYIGLIISSIFISILLYFKFIIPNKREKARMIDEYKQIIKDISYIEWIFIIFKRNGKCIFYKLYISKEKNQERINKYISFLSVSKNTAKSRSLISEISYEGKILLEANGKHIAASLVLSKNCSKILKNNFKEFIYKFETLYENILENGEDNLIPYLEIEKLLEDKLNIFITQPHEIENDFLDNVSLLKSESKAFSFNNRFIVNKNSINLFYKATTLIKKTSKNFFYISTLLDEFSKQNNKGITKFFISINELRHKGVFNTISHKY